MGTNYLDYLAEGFRVLKLNGYIIIAEVKSRMPDINSFINLVKGMGCKILKRVNNRYHFRMNTTLILHYLYFKKYKMIVLSRDTLNKRMCSKF